MIFHAILVPELKIISNCCSKLFTISNVTFMAGLGGPMNVMPFSCRREAKAVFSDRNPKPG